VVVHGRRLSVPVQQRGSAPACSLLFSLHPRHPSRGNQSICGRHPSLPLSHVLAGGIWRSRSTHASAAADGDAHLRTAAPHLPFLLSSLIHRAPRRLRACRGDRHWLGGVHFAPKGFFPFGGGEGEVPPRLLFFFRRLGLPIRIEIERNNAASQRRTLPASPRLQSGEFSFLLCPL
jgi:hypothetical protein